MWETRVNFLLFLMVSGRVVLAKFKRYNRIPSSVRYYCASAFLVFMTDHFETSGLGDLSAPKGPSAEYIQANVTFPHRHFLLIRRIKMFYCLI